MSVLDNLKGLLKSEIGETFKLKALLRNAALFFLFYIPISSQYFIFIPWLKQYKNNLEWYILVPFNIIYAISLLNFFICSFIDPGKVNKKVTKGYLPSEYMASMKGVKNEHFLRYKENSLDNIIEVENKVLKEIYDKKMWCKHCLSYKPPRAHHCSICKHCVLKFDHHCIWINNCVGHKNLPFFLRFIIYISLLFTVGFILVFFIIKGYIMFQDRYYSELTFPVTNVSRKMVVFMIINGFLSVVLYFFILSMALYQIIYLVRNVTRIEKIQVSRIGKLVERGILEVSQKYPYDLGLFQNIEQVFGKNYWLWWLCSFPSGDGTEFQTNQPDNMAIHWPPLEFILYEKYPYRSKEFYSGVANGTIEPPSDILEESQDNLHDYQNGPISYIGPKIRKTTKSIHRNEEHHSNLHKKVSITQPSSSINSYSNTKKDSDDSDDSDNDVLFNILLRKKEKQK